MRFFPHKLHTDTFDDSKIMSFKYFCYNKLPVCKLSGFKNWICLQIVLLLVHRYLSADNGMFHMYIQYRFVLIV